MRLMHGVSSREYPIDVNHLNWIEIRSSQIAAIVCSAWWGTFVFRVNNTDWRIRNDCIILNHLGLNPVATAVFASCSLIPLFPCDYTLNYFNCELKHYIPIKFTTPNKIVETFGGKLDPIFWTINAAYCFIVAGSVHVVSTVIQNPIAMAFQASFVLKCDQCEACVLFTFWFRLLSTAHLILSISIVSNNFSFSVLYEFL